MSSLAPSDHVVVVGAGLAGWRLVESLRREGYDGALTLIGDETEAPYDRPPLSKQVLAGTWTADQVRLATDERLAAARVTPHFGVGARSLDVATTTVHLNDGTAVAGTHVAIATGARARRLPLSAGERVHVLRTLRDVEALVGDVESLGDGRVVAIVGGGFIGAEVATSLAARGLRPVVFEMASAPLVSALGPTVAGWLARLPVEAGIELRVNQRVLDVTEAGGELVVHVEGAGEFAAAAVVAGAGAIPNDDWLATSGLTLDNGVVVDEHLMATDRVGALGDVARFTWRGPLGDQLVRIEHWQVAADHAASLARYWVSGATQSSFVPYFWSDQYGRKIQLLGHPHPGDDVTRVDERDDGRWLALYSHDGVVTGVVGLNMPRQLTLSRPLLESPTLIENATRDAPWRV